MRSQGKATTAGPGFVIISDCGPTSQLGSDPQSSDIFPSIFPTSNQLLSLKFPPQYVLFHPLLSVPAAITHFSPGQKQEMSNEGLLNQWATSMLRAPPSPQRSGGSTGPGEAGASGPATAASGRLSH